MSNLKYNVGQNVVLGEMKKPLEITGIFVKGAVVRISKLCDSEEPHLAHYEISKKVKGEDVFWWCDDLEINHEATAKLKLTEFEKAAKPLIKFLAENYHPHHTAIVTMDSAELLESKMRTIVSDYVPD